MQTTAHRTTSRFSLHRRVCFTDKQLRPQKPSSDRPEDRFGRPKDHSGVKRKGVRPELCIFVASAAASAAADGMAV